MRPVINAHGRLTKNSSWRAPNTCMYPAPAGRLSTEWLSTTRRRPRPECDERPLRSKDRRAPGAGRRSDHRRRGSALRSAPWSSAPPTTSCWRTCPMATRALATRHAHQRQRGSPPSSARASPGTRAAIWPCASTPPPDSTSSLRYKTPRQVRNEFEDRQLAA